MNVSKANRAQFYFFCAGQKPETFEVMNFSGTDRVSWPYEFDVTLLSKKVDVPVQEVVASRATLMINRGGEFYPYSGVVSEFSFVDQTTDYCVYRASLVPRLWLLSLNFRTRIFQKMSVMDIVREVLDAGGLSDYHDFRVDGSSYPQREYVVQYRETDLNFISRLLEESGAWYFFREQPLLEEEVDGSTGSEKLIVTDKSSEFEFVPVESSLPYRSRSGMVERVDEDHREHVFRMEVDSRAVASSVRLKGYNYRTPEVDLLGEKPVQPGSGGMHYEFGGSMADTGQAQRAARVVSERAACMQSSCRGSSTCRGMRAGSRFSVEDHARADFNGEFLAVRVQHSGSHFQGEEGLQSSSYTNQFTAVSADRAQSYRPPRRALRPSVPGVLTARIEADGSPYAALDDMGRYKVRMLFDTSDRKNYDASKYVRLAQFYSGPNYGAHFPSHEGAEMVIGCVDGDPDKPMGIGTVPNANTSSPVKSANKEKSVIRTAAGNELILDDLDGKEKIVLATPGGNAAELNDEHKRCGVKTADGNTLVLDDTNEHTRMDTHGHTITASYKGGEEGIVLATAGGHVIKVDDANKLITIQTGGGHGVELSDNNKTITLKDSAGKNTVTLDGGGGLTLDSQGKIEITAAQDLVIDAANVKVSSRAATEVSAGTDCTLKGMNVEAKGSMGATVEGGMSASFKGGTTAKLEGAMVDVAGSAKTAVKGGIVMIN